MMSGRVSEVGADGQKESAFQKGYLSIGAYWLPAGGGRYAFEHYSDRESGQAGATLTLSAGVHAAAYYALNQSIHVGIFFDALHASYALKPTGSYEFSASSLERHRQINLGFSAKLGRRVGPLFVSFASDLGMASDQAHLYSLSDEVQMPVQRGLWLHPRAQIDFLVSAREPLAFELFVGLGPCFQVVWGDVVPSSEGHRLARRLWSLAPTLSFGGNFGS